MPCDILLAALHLWYTDVLHPARARIGIRLLYPLRKTKANNDSFVFAIVYVLCTLQFMRSSRNAILMLFWRIARTNGVLPHPSCKSGSTPLCKSCWTIFSKPWAAAKCKAVLEYLSQRFISHPASINKVIMECCWYLPARRKGVALSPSPIFRSAPASNSRFTMFLCPFCAAVWSAVRDPLLILLTSHLLFTRNATTLVWPCKVAYIKGVLYHRSLALIFAPTKANRATWPVRPLLAATCKAAWPYRLLLSTPQPPFSSKTWSTSLLTFSAAKCSALFPSLSDPLVVAPASRILFIIGKLPNFVAYMSAVRFLLFIQWTQLPYLNNKSTIALFSHLVAIIRGEFPSKSLIFGFVFSFSKRTTSSMSLYMQASNSCVSFLFWKE